MKRSEDDRLVAGREIPELATAPGAKSRIMVWLIVAFIVLVIGWAWRSHMDIVASARGRIVPSGHVKSIQASEHGVVRTIHVRDGERVHKDQILVELDATAIDADRRRLRRDLLNAELDRARLEALLDDAAEMMVPEGTAEQDVVFQRRMLQSYRLEAARRIRVLEEEIERFEATVATTRSELEKYRSLLPVHRRRLEENRAHAERGLLARHVLTPMELNVIETEREIEVHENRLREERANLRAAREKLSAMRAERRRELVDALADSRLRRYTAREELVKADQRGRHQVIRSPVDGTVQELAVHTDGGVIEAGRTLMTIVPMDAKLEVEADIANRDVGLVQSGQRVRIKIDAYEFTRFGTLDGELQWVADDSVTMESSGPVYPARIALAEFVTPNAVDGVRGRAAIGMGVTADIVVGRRRVIDFFLSPLLRYRDESLRER